MSLDTQFNSPDLASTIEADPCAGASGTPTLDGDRLYVLTENGLYTKEAWSAFLNHLNPDGILTMSRWYQESQPAETLRLTALATSALLDMGVEDPRKHIMIVRKKDSSATGQYSVATILVCRRPFTDAEINRVDDLSREMEYLPVLTPKFAESPEFGRVAVLEIGATNFSST